jgi:hypothetical protein
MLASLHAIYEDEDALVESAQAGRWKLERLFEAGRGEAGRGKGTWPVVQILCAISLVGAAYSRELPG